MAEPTLTFLGEQIKRMQSELRGIRAEQLRLEADQAAIRAEVAAGFSAIDTRFDNLDRAMDARFDQAHGTMATNLAVILEAIKGLKSGQA